MNITFDLHTHTVYSHGKGTVEENAVSAKEKGLYGIGITDHGFSHPAFGMRRKKLDLMRADCAAAEEKTGEKILLGIESNLRGESGSIDVVEKDYPNLDLILAGVHRFIFYKSLGDFVHLLCGNVFRSVLKSPPSKRLVDYNTRCYVNAVKNNPIDVLTHVGYLCYCDPVEVAKVCADYGTYFEINTKKTHLSDEDWRKVIDTGVRFVIDSDAHSVDRIGDTAQAEELFKRVDFPLDRIDNIDGRLPNLRFANYKKEHGIESKNTLHR